MMIRKMIRKTLKYFFPFKKRMLHMYLSTSILTTPLSLVIDYKLPLPLVGATVANVMIIYQVSD